MSIGMDSLHICGNILCTKNFSYFELRCNVCNQSFGQWTLFIKHLELKHSDENDDNIFEDLMKAEWDPAEYVEEDDKYSIKNELVQFEEAENPPEFISNTEIKDESEMEEEYIDNDLIEEHLEDDSMDEVYAEDSQEETENFDVAAVAITHTDKTTKNELGQIKSFSFNLQDVDLKQASLEFLKVFEENALLWDYNHEDYRKPFARTKALTQIQLHLKKTGYLASDIKLHRVIPKIFRDYRKAKEKLAMHGKLDKHLRLLLNKCKFLKEHIEGANLDNTDYDAALSVDHESDSDGTEDFLRNPEYKVNSRYKRIRFHVPSNKLVIDLINLWRDSPLLWDIARADYNNSFDRKHIIESWIPIFKKRHNVALTYEDLNINLQLLRRYYSTLSTRKVLDEAAKYIRDECNFLPTKKNKGRIKCGHCYSFFLTANNYKAHLYCVHQIGESPFKCGECDKEFPAAHLLDVHVKSVHIKQFDFACTMCEKRFLRKYDLTFHMHIHTGEKSFICETCGKGFRRRVNLKNHETRIHLRQRNFTCHMCPKAFYTKALLKDHLNAHLDIRNFKCPFCDKGFHSAHALMRHKQIHAEVKRYACKLCEAKFHQFVGLNSHMKNRHKFVQAKDEDETAAPAGETEISLGMCLPNNIIN